MVLFDLHGACYGQLGVEVAEFGIPDVDVFSDVPRVPLSFLHIFESP